MQMCCGTKIFQHKLSKKIASTVMVQIVSESVNNLETDSINTKRPGSTGPTERNVTTAKSKILRAGLLSAKMNLLEVLQRKFATIIWAQTRRNETTFTPLELMVGQVYIKVCNTISSHEMCFHVRRSNGVI